MAPGSQECPPLHVGHRVVAAHSCTHGASPPETACTFYCHKGYELVGPPVKHCQLDGTWTDAGLSVECQGNYLAFKYPGMPVTSQYLSAFSSDVPNQRLVAVAFSFLQTHKWVETWNVHSLRLNISLICC